jgi:hypothetical protein
MRMRSPPGSEWDHELVESKTSYLPMTIERSCKADKIEVPAINFTHCDKIGSGYFKCNVFPNALERYMRDIIHAHPDLSKVHYTRMALL